MHVTRKSLGCGTITSFIETNTRMKCTRTHPPTDTGAYLDGGLPCDVGDKEVHSDILAVDVLVHHVSDGLGHHVRIQVGVILSGRKGPEHC